MSSQQQLLKEPTSLNELQAMSGDEIRRIESLQDGRATGPVAISKFMRLATKLAVQETWTEKRSLREFWYNPIKPLAQKAFPEYLNDPSPIDKSFNEYFAGKTSSYVSELALEPNSPVTYRDLNVFDETRTRAIRDTGFEGKKILFVEKEAAYRKIKGLAEAYELSVVSGGGFESTAAIEEIASNLNSNNVYRLYVVSDYDPAGFKIVDDFQKRAGQLGISLLSVERIGINPDQVDNQILQQQRFKPSITDNHGNVSAYNKRWMSNHAIDGQYGLEIEAISGGTNGGQQIRKILVNEFQDKDVINEEGRFKRDIENQTVRAVDDAAARGSSELLSDIEDELYDRMHKQGREIVKDQPGVTKANRYGVDMDLDVVRQNPSQYLPSAPRSGELHDSAADGKQFAVSNRSAERELKRDMKASITAQEIRNILGEAGWV